MHYRDSLRKPGASSLDEAPHRLSGNTGVKRYQQNPNAEVTAEMVMTEVLALPPEAWGTGIREHECK